MNSWVCDFCFPESKEIGLIAPGLALLFHDDKYYLCWGQGHRGDEIFYCEEKPTIDPDPDCLSDSDDWMQKAYNAYDRLVMPVDSGYSFMLTCMEGGYSRECGLIAYWLYDKCGKVLLNYERNLNV